MDDLVSYRIENVFYFYRSSCGGIDFKKHAGVIAYFQKEYIKTGEFDKKYSKYLQAAFQIRNNCDYSDFFIVSREDAEEQYQHALEMLNAICSYLKKEC